ncbi:hypothetical protein [Roseateles depolymerans]|uniref:Uncharacterized protein n=1 Tax=Roseateles depolymerans TaxID=76731 RepID=A0A0U3L725_9BURK|nr:hypothetical protein [Roseateles depolymerans]ALV07086.1 hypothetical protein RD2015_2621 [Roseateles depolymerans]REG20069.1 hypothetical protein DES44_2575 [Roseateles depolymerans]
MTPPASWSAGARVTLDSFNGLQQSPDDTSSAHNYWLLVGERGTVVDSPTGPFAGSGAPRVLVQFDKSVKSLGLECHNAVDNALWILVSDLSRLE